MDRIFLPHTKPLRRKVFKFFLAILRLRMRLKKPFNQSVRWLEYLERCVFGLILKDIGSCVTSAQKDKINLALQSVVRHLCRPCTFLQMGQYLFYLLENSAKVLKSKERPIFTAKAGRTRSF
ncbi:MAG: hypothetical protein B5M51_05095 [Anaerolinea sp. 4484_236]|nr:MAG: hypothetical protein B5M51_05095 [Anaerolinea sp. 4484_236]